MSTFNNESIDEIRAVSDITQKQLKSLNSLRVKINWFNRFHVVDGIEKERYDLDKLYFLIKSWQGPLSNFRDIFLKKEINCLLSDSINYIQRGRQHEGELIIKFVARTGFRDEPKVDKKGKPLLHRTTPVHLAARFNVTGTVVRELFKIYNRFDVNYIDKLGRTHFHVACMYGFVDVVEKFLELGQDPNCLTKKSIDPPLILALDHHHWQLAEILLKNNADPNVANAKGLTALHIIVLGDDDGSLNAFFKINDERLQTVQIDARTKLGNTPLHLAMRRRNNTMVEILLRRGADSN
uniref:Death domain-containing protein n=1 Tax=Trichogramma kaykai TaxID=54128 RepID=A0ABD2WWR4_9HYME